jgi:(1->4)-alpha-D-glucan 1-alpha-D-glucosylmutase
MRIPKATYRIQFNQAFDFHRAKRIVPYLAELGISDIYASPIFKARKESLHGYDTVDPNQINPELGDLNGFYELTDELTRRGIGWIQDIVPNHMAFDYENQMLMDVLENGEGSDYSDYFDIDWNHPSESLRGTLLAPFLGSFYAESLEAGDITLRYGPSGLTVNYYDLTLPLELESYGRFFTCELSCLRKRLGTDHPDFINLLDVLYVVKMLSSIEDRKERYERARFIKSTLWDLYSRNEEIHKFIDDNITRFNGQKGDPGSFDLLNGLLSEQLFRLSFWKVATEEINYRRFFNINDLICVRVEKDYVFEHLHALVFKLIREQKITGLRIDHIDGLHDPKAYLKRLRERVGEVYCIVEKILDQKEDLPSSWTVEGTTGYDFMNYVNGLFCQGETAREYDRIYERFTDFKMPYNDLVYKEKGLIMGKHMAGDIDNLAHLMRAISSRDRHGSDITIYGLKNALVEVMAHFPVYRTYIDEESSTQGDFHYLKVALDEAKQNSPGLLNELQFIERFLLLDFSAYLSEEQKKEWTRFVMRFQQFTGPLMAKGFEDTVLYVYNRLLSLNEVGGNPKEFGVSRAEFDSFNKRRAERWCHSLNATSTHDTKRGEDTRARINVLSEIPEEWERNLKRWSRINRKGKHRINGRRIPDRNDEYFLYQTLIGAFPLDEKAHPQFVKRIKEYVIKAVREAKVHTGWLKPDAAYEAGYLAFVESVLNPVDSNTFLREFRPFQKKISHYGIFNSLVQTLLKITSPGVPDFYQGTETWDLTLVDPDNRRPVDFEKRAVALQDIRTRVDSDLPGLIHELLRTREDGRIKLFLIHRALSARNEDIEVFQKGVYTPLEVTGRFRDHVIAFARNQGRTWALTVVPRFLTSVITEREVPVGRATWSDTAVHLPPKTPQVWRNVITNDRVRGPGLLVGEVFKQFPVALFVNKEAK